MNEYLRVSRSATYGFLSAIPLFLGYEVLMVLGRSSVQVSAEKWLKDGLSRFGVVGHLALGLGVLLVGVLIMIAERPKEVPIKPGYLGGIVGESLLWTPFFAVATGWLVHKAMPQAALWPLAATLTQQNRLTRVGLALGAGVYEELLFRVLLVGGMCWLGSQAFPKHRTAVRVTTACVGAFVFSLIHYIGPLGDPVGFNTTFIYSFLFRYIAGLLLNTLYLVRGFGVAAWTHAWYDVMVLLH